MKFSLAALALVATLAHADNDDQCGLYLAVSSTSTPDSAAWGLFAGKAYKPNDFLGTPELALNLPHLRANLPATDDLLSATVDFLESHIWVPEPAGAKFAISEGRAITAIPGAGALVGYHASFTNVGWTHHDVYFREGMGESPGVSHPGRGSTSPYYNVKLNAIAEIKPGSEIFLDYGENWRDEDAENDLDKDEYAKLDETVNKMIEFFDKHKELDAQAKEQVYKFLISDVMSAAVGPTKARKVATLLPQDPDDLGKVMEAGGTMAYAEPSVFRKLEWLEEHGRCMDMIEPKPSTIPHAGRGAFATRDIKQDGLISPVPLIHVPFSEVFDTHKLEKTGDETFTRESDDVTGQQLIVNYVYGHPDSTMVFIPVGSTANFINHHAEKVNAKMVWSQHMSHEKGWMELAPEELLDESYLYIGLVMEIVATRDIKAGEEIFLDYGSDWQAAWDEHSKAWEERVKNKEIPETWPLRANELVNTYYKDKPYKTMEEALKEPYPENVENRAFLMILESENEGTLEDPKVWGQPPDGTTFDADNLFNLEIVAAYPVDDYKSNIVDCAAYNYTIRWSNNQGSHTYVDKVPHEAIVLIDTPDTGDDLRQNTFRHYIEIPDDIFPQGTWRNIVDEEEEENVATE